MLQVQTYRPRRGELPHGRRVYLSGPRFQGTLGQRAFSHLHRRGHAGQRADTDLTRPRRGPQPCGLPAHRPPPDRYSPAAVGQRGRTPCRRGWPTHGISDVRCGTPAVIIHEFETLLSFGVSDTMASGLYDVILGAPFFRAHGVNIDYEQNVATARGWSLGKLLPLTVSLCDAGLCDPACVAQFCVKLKDLCGP